jgi:hypothetical protein
MGNSNRNVYYWHWYRILYLLFWLGLSLFYGSRIEQTLRYWTLLPEWQVFPGRIYLLVTGIAFLLLGIASAIWFFLRQDKALFLLCGTSLVYFIWRWVDQLLVSHASDRFDSILFLIAEMVLYGLWMMLVFRKEIFHAKVR